MRPPEFTGGNANHARKGGAPASRFNEAAGIHRRKPAADKANVNYYSELQ